MKSLKSEKGFAEVLIIAFIFVVLVAGIGFYVLNRQKSTNGSSAAGPTTSKVSHPGIIKAEAFTSSIDSAGAPVKPTKSFSISEPKIYVVVSLSNAKTAQRLEYTRYLNGKFVDNGSLAVAKDGAKYASFDFSLKVGKTHPKGTYLIKTYTNGVFERSATYTVQ